MPDRAGYPVLNKGRIQVALDPFIQVRIERLGVARSAWRQDCNLIRHYLAGRQSLGHRFGLLFGAVVGHISTKRHDPFVTILGHRHILETGLLQRFSNIVRH